MGTRIVAATVIVAIGAIAIYDATFVLPSVRSNGSKNEHVVPTAVEPVSPHDDEADAGVADPQHAGENGAADSGDVIAQFDPSRQFTGNWPNPFASEGYRTPPRMHSVDETTPEQGVNPFTGYEPNVKAVMITGTHRRVIIDRLVLSEGDTVPGAGAIVRKVMPHGVELEKNDIVRFFPITK